MNILKSSPRMGVDDGINAARHLIGHCEFDEASCSEGLKALRAYRKEWDEAAGCWRDKPRHDWASHGADAFRCLASRYRNIETPPPKAKPAENVIVACGPGGRVAYAQGGVNILEWANTRAKKRRTEEGYL